MQKVLTAAEMREVDRLTTEKYGIPSILLMENAAHAVARVITEKLGGSVNEKSVLVLCGKGNNGGDGAALSRTLSLAGARVELLLFGKIEDTKGDARTNFEAAVNTVDWFRQITSSEEWDHWLRSNWQDWDVVVDAIFGTGLSRPVNEWLGRIIGNINLLNEQNENSTRIAISVDLPSGLNSDSANAIGETFRANVTVTFTSPKPANVLAPASGFNGELVVAEIGSPWILIEEQPSELFVTEAMDVTNWLADTDFSDDSYKNKRGHALIVAGSENYSGAAVLCGNAAIRSGVGLVTIGTPRSSKESIAGRVVPEVMVRPLAETNAGAVSEAAIEEVEGFLKNVNAIAIGSGLSANDESTRKFVRHFAENRRVPTVLDADALTLLSPFSTNWPPADAGGSDLILTPHQGEFLRMLGTEDKSAIEDRVVAVREFAQKHNVILVLKGERALIGEPGGKVVVNPTGNSGLGKAGNGDTLTGIITGFVAQAFAVPREHTFYTPEEAEGGRLSNTAFEAVVAAVYVAGLAGDIAEKKYGKRVMTASDVRECLVEAFTTVNL